MIRLLVDPASIKIVESAIAKKAKEIEYVASPIVMTEISKAVFTITAKRFLRDLAAAAVQDPKRYHHLYEWSAIGKNKEKLFIMKRVTVQYGNLTIGFVPLRSRMPVPIDPILKSPGVTGKSVVAEHVFREKMKMMEDNTPVRIVTKRTIAFVGDDEHVVFVPKNKVINIMHPGGDSTTHALRDFSTTWYKEEGPNVVAASRLMSRVATEVTRVLNSGNSNNTKIRDAVKRVALSYSNELSEL